MKFTDSLAGTYTEKYPIVSLSETETFESYVDHPEILVSKNVWYQSASEEDKKNIIDKLLVTATLVSNLLEICKVKYPNLVIRHISVGGSYVFKKGTVNDIDFNIIVQGSYFLYEDIFEIAAINEKITDKVKKISLMIFGEDDLLRKTNICDTIEAKDYIHTSLLMREGVVFSMRNIPLFGHLCTPQPLDKKNLLVRINRQLFHAELMIRDEVDLHRTAQERLIKSIGRISEALVYLSVGFPDLLLSTRQILEDEKRLCVAPDPEGATLLLEKARRCTDMLIT